MWYVKLFAVHAYIVCTVYRWAFSALLLPTWLYPLLHVPVGRKISGDVIVMDGRLLHRGQANELPDSVRCWAQILDRSRFLGKNTRPKARVCDPVVGWFLWFGGLVCFSLSYFVWCFLSFFSCHMPMRLMIVSRPVAPKQQSIGFLNP